jgi:hypothetical protein
MFQHPEKSTVQLGSRPSVNEANPVRKPSQIENRKPKIENPQVPA